MAFGMMPIALAKGSKEVLKNLKGPGGGPEERKPPSQ